MAFLDAGLVSLRAKRGPFFRRLRQQWHLARELTARRWTAGLKHTTEMSTFRSRGLQEGVGSPSSHLRGLPLLAVLHPVSKDIKNHRFPWQQRRDLMNL